MRGFPHLHTHTENSILDGLRQTELAVRLMVRSRGVDTIAITDHGTIAGAPQFKAACDAEGVKGIVGMEAYFTPDALVKDRDKRVYGHITLLARNRAGYRNLIRLCTAANEDQHYYYRPRVDWAMLEQHHEGVVAMTGCAGGVLAKAIQDGAGSAMLDRLTSIFGRENVRGEVMYLDIQPAGLNAAIRSACRKQGVEVVATNDVHYPLPEDADLHPMLTAISTHGLLGDPKTFRIDSKELYAKSWEEMEACGRRDGGLPGHVAREMDAAVALAAEIENYSVQRKVQYPIPTRWQGQDPHRVLCELARGALARLGKAEDPRYAERLEEELRVIDYKQFSRYFLVLADLYGWIQEQRLVCGPGRGSAAASLVTYVLGITGLDPIQFPVMRFERFLNPERIDDPDVDCDLASEDRARVYDHLVETYGSEHVAHLGTFSTYAPKALINDFARALGMKDVRIKSWVLTSTWIQYVYEMATAQAEGREPLVMYDDLKIFLKEADEKLDEMERRSGFPVRRAYLAMSGQVRHLGTHACAMVLSEEPLRDVAPVVRVRGHHVVGYIEGVYRKVLSKTGLLKLDLLGVQSLQIIKDAFAQAGLPEEVRWDDVDYEDDRVLEMYRSGSLTGIFQYEQGYGIREMTQRIAPTRFRDLYTILALWRPGPLDSGMADEYVKLKKQGARRLHPAVDPILDDSLGMMIFQEDMIALYAHVADCTLGQADMFRRDVIKRVVDDDLRRRLDEYKGRWESGRAAKGIPAAIAKQLWEEMLAFMRYGFNAPHSISYAAIGYRMMWLKVYHPAAFIAAALPLAFDKGTAQHYVAEARRLGVDVIPPDINHSRLKPQVTPEGKVAMHFQAVKGVGDKAAKVILAAQPFASVADFRERVPRRSANKTVLTALAMVGAFSGLEGAGELYADFGIDPATVGTRRANLQYLTLVLDTTLPPKASALFAQRAKREAGKVIQGGLVLAVRNHQTRKGAKMAYARLHAHDDTVWELLFWPTSWGAMERFVKPGTLLIVKGKPDEFAEDKIIVDTAAPVSAQGEILPGAKTIGRAKATRWGRRVRNA